MSTNVIFSVILDLSGFLSNRTTYRKAKKINVFLNLMQLFGFLSMLAIVAIFDTFAINDYNTNYADKKTIFLLIRFVIIIINNSIFIFFSGIFYILWFQLIVFLMLYQHLHYANIVQSIKQIKLFRNKSSKLNQIYVLY